MHTRPILYFASRGTSRGKVSSSFLNPNFYCVFKGEDSQLYHSCTDYYRTNQFKILGDEVAAEKVHAAKFGDEIQAQAKILEKAYIDTDKWKKWEDSKVDVMRAAIKKKFEQNLHLMRKLLITGEKMLVLDDQEDTFWGGASSDSKNVFGELLMDLRDTSIRKSKVIPVSAREARRTGVEEDSSDDDIEAEKSDSSTQDADYEFVEAMKAFAIVSPAKASSFISALLTGSLAKEIKIETIQKDDLKKLAQKEADSTPPLMYLTDEETVALVDECEIVEMEKDAELTSIGDPKDTWDAYFIVKGDAYVFNRNGFLEVIPKGTLFGIDGYIFKERFYTIKAGDNLVVMKIPPNILKKYLKKDSKLTLNIARNMLLKQNILGPLNEFKEYIRQIRSGIGFNKDRLLNYYKAMKSSLHPYCNSPNLDTDSWLYANRRLPQNITSTLAFYITNKCPETLVHPDVVVPVKTTSRPRQILQTMPGKCVVILRDLETDLYDFIANFCIHIVEAEKVMKKLRSPALFRDLLMSREDQAQVLKILENTDLNEKEIKGLDKIWPTNLGENLANILMHFNNFYVTISAPSSHLKLDATESWVRKLWFATIELLQLKAGNTCESIPDKDMTIDILQGSRRAFTNLLSPHTYLHRKDIMDWAKKTNPKLTNKTFNCPEDELNAYAYYYYSENEEATKERQKLEKKNGILRFDQSGGTGVSITLVDCSKIKPDQCDPGIVPKCVSKYHIIINIGYTFGVQSSDIIRSMMNMFGHKIRTINIVGKAGGLVGKKGDILLASRIHSDDSFEVVNNNLGTLDLQELAKAVKRPLYVGPMLTVAGTVIQNSILLNYYQKLCHCVGLEMEGLHFAKEIKRYKELGIIREDVASRFAYYISDLPLDPDSNLSKEEGEINFDEGVPAMNAIYRVFIQTLFK